MRPALSPPLPYTLRPHATCALSPLSPHGGGTALSQGLSQLTLATTADTSVTVTQPAITNAMTDAQCEALLTASVPALTNTTAAGYVAPYYASWDADTTLDAASTGTCNGGYSQSALLIGASAQTDTAHPRPSPLYECVESGLRTKPSAWVATRGPLCALKRRSEGRATRPPVVHEI